MSARVVARRRQVAGVSLIELIVVIVVLAILGAGFMAMYGDVTRHNASNDQAAPMAWVGQGVMETELLQSELGLAPFTLNPTAFGPYQASATWTTAASQTIQGVTYSAYQVTVTVTCASGACPSLILTSYVYTT